MKNNKNKFLRNVGVVLATATLLGVPTNINNKINKLEEKNITCSSGRNYNSHKDKFSNLYNLLLDYKLDKECRDLDNTSELENYLSQNYPKAINGYDINFEELEYICKENNKICILRPSYEKKEDPIFVLGDFKDDVLEYEYNGEKVNVDYTIIFNAPITKLKPDQDYVSWYSKKRNHVYLNHSRIKDYVEGRYYEALVSKKEKTPTYTDKLRIELYNKYPKKQDFINIISNKMIDVHLRHESVHEYYRNKFEDLEGFSDEHCALLEEIKFDPEFNALTLINIRVNSEFADNSEYYSQYKLAEDIFFNLVKENYGLNNSEVEGFIIDMPSEARSELLKNQ